MPGGRHSRPRCESGGCFLCVLNAHASPRIRRPRHRNGKARRSKAAGCGCTGAGSTLHAHRRSASGCKKVHRGSPSNCRAPHICFSIGYHTCAFCRGSLESRFFTWRAGKPCVGSSPLWRAAPVRRRAGNEAPGNAVVHGRWRASIVFDSRTSAASRKMAWQPHRTWCWAVWRAQRTLPPRELEQGGWLGAREQNSCRRATLPSSCRRCRSRRPARQESCFL